MRRPSLEHAAILDQMILRRGLENVQELGERGELPEGCNTPMGEQVRVARVRSSWKAGVELDTPSAMRSVQAQAESDLVGETATPEVVRRVISQPGKPLEGAVREEMEQRMGDSFSDVQLHTGPEAAKAASALEARAFTTGNHVVFNRGEYDPESPDGKYLLAHELAHVRQQTGGQISMLPQEGSSLVIDPDPELEREADEVARKALEGEEPVITHRLGLDVSIQRTPEVSRREVLKGNVGLEEVEEATGDLEFGDVDHSKVAAAGLTSLLPVIGPMLDQYVDQKFAPQQLQARLRQIDPPEEWVEQTARRAASMIGNIETGDGLVGDAQSRR
ncbi:eCIS core domain-containing protein [Natronobiforma cellulositropha]|uniref:eCIS core domain-containing protein n=1 Tax=Natronobiforma cellulositropha TaxID=1679076 RepID=UPI003CCE3529